MVESEIIDDIRRVARLLGKKNGELFHRQEYWDSGGRASNYFLYLDGKDWIYFATTAGYASARNEFLQDDVYLDRLRTAIKVLHRLPKTSERRRFGLNFTKSRWPTLRHFLKDAARQGVIPTQLVGDLLDDGQTIATDKMLSQDVANALSPSDTCVTEEKPPGNRPIPPIPARTRQAKWGRTGVIGHPYEPHNETGVIALFAILCANGTIPWQILTISSTGIDATCSIDMPHEEVRVEFKRILSGQGWNHPDFDFDYLVCWENRWKGTFPKPIIELRKVILKRIES